MTKMTYSEILSENNRLAEELKDQPMYTIAVLSNITVNQIKEILEYYLRSNKINAQVDVGNYDNIVQDSIRFKNHKLVIVFWEISNLIDGLQYKSELMTDIEITEIIDKIKSEINFVLENLKSVQSIIWNKFSNIVFNRYNIEPNNLDRICNELNMYMKATDCSNVSVIDIEKVFANLSIDKAVDLRYFYAAKALYTIDFYKAYVEFILPIPLSLLGRTKKALIFDCDNTLWKGILGEDGFNQIIMSSKQKGGTPYEEVQTLALSLQKKGILLCLCSKNNAPDVDEVFEKNPYMKIRNKHLSLKMINWNDKVSNLREIQRVLNIGFDSFVYIDDSDFELEFINRILPDVTTVKVPQKIFYYPIAIREVINLFYSQTLSPEDIRRGEMYRDQKKRANLKISHKSLIDYLRALEMRMNVFVNEKSHLSRISQMTQKTNQFNLTTKRYTEKEILSFIENPNVDIFSISVSDKIGDSGITGLAIVFKKNQVAHFDTFLMSCRIIGRNIEYTFFDFIIDFLKRIKIKKITAEYIKTTKNGQVNDLFDRLNFQVKIKNDYFSKYELNIDNYKKSDVNYIKINHAK